MSCVQKVSCELADDREVYIPGEAVNGQWVVTVGESVQVTGIRISFVGMTYVKWSEGLSVRANRSRDVITNQWTDVLEEINYTKEGQNYVIPAGMHHYKFNFKLPEHAIPSSYEGVCGAVRYWLKLAIHRSSMLHAEKDRYKPITVLDYIDVNAAAFRNGVERKAEVNVPRVLAMGDQGSVFLYAETDRAAYCPGEEILISVNARNKSEKDCGIVEASLIQKALFSSPSTTRIARKQLVLRTVHGSPLLKKTTEIWRNNPIKIDPVPPSTRDGTCLLITVSYFVKVTIKATSVWPFAEFGDIIVKLPITIGTTPRGLESSAVEATESTIDVDLPETCDFMYTPCEKGFEYFSDDGDDFPAIKYKPFCVCVQDLRSNATATKDGKAVASDTAPSIVVQQLSSNDNKWPANSNCARQEPSAPPFENSVPRKQSSAGSQPGVKEPSASTMTSDSLPSYDEAMAQDIA